MRYTPGPWEVSKIGNNYDQYSIYAENTPTQDIVNTVEGEANAKLIAVAPEAIEALIILEDILGTLYQSGRIEWNQDDAPVIDGHLEFAKYVIEKAGLPILHGETLDLR